jgi:hypothetical protein
MKPSHIRRLIALPYLILGSWCLLAPKMVEQMTVTPDYQHLIPNPDEADSWGISKALIF